MPKHTLSLREMERQARRQRHPKLTIYETNYWRPKTRADCAKVPRPCPYVSCRYNLFLDVCPNGSLRLPHGETPEAVLAQKTSCALDLAAEGERTLDEVGRVQGLTRERVRQIEGIAVQKVREVVKDGAAGNVEGGAEEHSLIGGSKFDQGFANAQAIVTASTSGCT